MDGHEYDLVRFIVADAMMPAGRKRKGAPGIKRERFRGGPVANWFRTVKDWTYPAKWARVR